MLSRWSMSSPSPSAVGCADLSKLREERKACSWLASLLSLKQEGFLASKSSSTPSGGPYATLPIVSVSAYHLQGWCNRTAHADEET